LLKNERKIRFCVLKAQGRNCKNEKKKKKASDYFGLSTNNHLILQFLFSLSLKFLNDSELLLAETSETSAKETQPALCHFTADAAFCLQCNVLVNTQLLEEKILQNRGKA